MGEIYWLTRLDSINTVSFVCMVIGIIITSVVAIIYYVTNGQVIYDDSCGRERSVIEGKGYLETCKGILMWSIPLTIISCLLVVFVPNTRQGFLIYGVGGTVDYIKSNPTAKQLPDKCINALDKWVDSWGVEKKDSIKK